MTPADALDWIQFLAEFFVALGVLGAFSETRVGKRFFEAAARRIFGE